MVLDRAPSALPGWCVDQDQQRSFNDISVPAVDIVRVCGQRQAFELIKDPRMMRLVIWLRDGLTVKR
jgi:hypothetical protein